MDGSILALNCGSSSIKFAVFSADLASLFKGQVENIGGGLSPRGIIEGKHLVLDPSLAAHDSIIAHLIGDIIVPRSGAVAAVGHRVVHGSTVFSRPVLIDEVIRARIAEFAPLAPSHQPHNLAGIDAVEHALPGVPQVACFDTAFHRTIAEHRQLFALPKRFADEGLRRFGFHGLSYDGAAGELARRHGASAGGLAVICHLGNGCSIAGLVDGRSAWTSMGFTPLEGLIMGRRPGRLDPGVVLWLVERHGVEAVDTMLNTESGILGISGISSDMRTLLAHDSEPARLAVTMFVDRLVQEIGAAAAAIGGIDRLVFTGGIGENAAAIRARTLDALGWLGFELDEMANGAHATTITTTASPRAAHVIAADEERVIARATAKLAGPDQG